MPTIAINEGVHSFQTRKKIGFPCGFGAIVFGASRFGLYSERFGVYQIRRRAGRQIVVKMNFMYPSNPQTAAQQARRSLFGYAVYLWQNFTFSEKSVYNQKAVGKHMSGYNLFISHYLRLFD